MLRQFRFEAEIYQSLSCIPMAVRRKLDRLGIKVGLEQWQRLQRGERLMICHAPIDSNDECEALRLFIHEATLSRAGSPPRSLAEETRLSADPPSAPPRRLVSNASKAGVDVTTSEWQQLDDDERYALIKLGDTDQPSHNLAAALREFLGESLPVSDA